MFSQGNDFHWIKLGSRTSTPISVKISASTRKAEIPFKKVKKKSRRLETGGRGSKRIE